MPSRDGIGMGIVGNRNSVTCSYCGTERVIKWDKRHNKSGTKQRYQCKDCTAKNGKNVTFTPNDGFLRKKHHKDIIVETVSLHVRGMSGSEAADHMWQIHGAGMHRTTVTRWSVEYSHLLKSYTDKLEPEIKGNSHPDEVIVKVRGQKEYRWGTIDRKTKYKISGRLTKKRTYKDGAKPLYWKLKHKCKGIPPKIITDKLGHYRRAFNKYFYNTSAKMVHGVPIACKKYGLEHNNNPAERDNARVKQRTKTMRGFGAHETAEAFLDMLDIHHNYIKPSMSLDGGYPAEESGIRLNLGRNRLLSLIHLASFG